MGRGGEQPVPPRGNVRNRSLPPRLHAPTAERSCPRRPTRRRAPVASRHPASTGPGGTPTLPSGASTLPSRDNHADVVRQGPERTSRSCRRVPRSRRCVDTARRRGEDRTGREVTGQLPTRPASAATRSPRPTVRSRGIFEQVLRADDLQDASVRGERRRPRARQPLGLSCTWPRDPGRPQPSSVPIWDPVSYLTCLPRGSRSFADSTRSNSAVSSCSITNAPAPGSKT